MTDILGYTIQAKLYESSRSTVYRGRDAGGRTVILKVMQTAMQAERPTREAQERYYWEYEILSRLDTLGMGD